MESRKPFDRFNSLFFTCLFSFPSTCMHATVTALGVCRQWRDCLLRDPGLFAALLAEAHGPLPALERAARCLSGRLDGLQLLGAALRIAEGSDGPSLPTALVHQQLCCCCGCVLCRRSVGTALEHVAGRGYEAGVRLLLEWRWMAPRADWREGQALVSAAANGHEAVVKLLLEWKEHAPRADCQGGEALVQAAAQGREALAHLLLGWREHAPRADCKQGAALICAAGGGHESVVRMLLGWRDNAPRADVNRGEALVEAAQVNRERLVG